MMVLKTCVVTELGLGVVKFYDFKNVIVKKLENKISNLDDIEKWVCLYSMLDLEKTVCMVWEKSHEQKVKIWVILIIKRS